MSLIEEMVRSIKQDESTGNLEIITRICTTGDRISEEIPLAFKVEDRKDTYGVVDGRVTLIESKIL